MKNERLMKVILSPHVSEKSALAEQDRQYVFKVWIEASKSDIKKAVELLFKVKVESVQTVLSKGKNKRFGRVAGRRSDYKKAYIKLQDGHTIDLTAGS